jgi:hypothetical protein
MKQQHQDSEVTIGLDLGERRHRFCALDSRGEVVEEGSLLNDRASLASGGPEDKNKIETISADVRNYSRLRQPIAFDACELSPLSPRKYGVANCAGKYH